MIGSVAIDRCGHASFTGILKGETGCWSALIFHKSCGGIQKSMYKVRNESMYKVRNVFEAILKYGHDEDFVPMDDRDFDATDSPAGSRTKIERLRQRVELGQPLWHEEDRRDYTGLTGAVRPRD